MKEAVMAFMGIAIGVSIGGVIWIALMWWGEAIGAWTVVWPWA